MVADGVVLQVQGLCFAYPGCVVLDQWSMALPAGLALVLGGESSGKTTLLRLLAGQLAAQAGRITLHGACMQDAPQAWRDNVFWADPRSDAFDVLTARAWLASLPAHHAGWDADALVAHVEGFSLQPHLDKPFYALSTGSRRKVLMAGALASGAPLTLIDEPMAGLDKPSTTYLMHALTQAAQQGGRVVVVAHHEPLPGPAWGTVVELADR